MMLLSHSIQSLDFIKANSFPIYGDTNVGRGWFVDAIAVPDVLYKLQTYDLLYESRELSSKAISNQNQIILFKDRIITNTINQTELTEKVWKQKRKRTVIVTSSITAGIYTAVIVILKVVLK